MTSKKPASSKQAAPPRACDYTKSFLKDWERLSRSGRYDTIIFVRTGTHSELFEE